MDQLRYWVGFNRAKGIGPARLRALIQHFGSIEAAWNAPAHALREVGLDQRALNSLLHTRQHHDLDADLETLERLGAQVITLLDAHYPPLLRQIPDAPPMLYVKGALCEADWQAVAVVGTRRATDYGRAMTLRIVEPLARLGVTIVSGLALGIDAAAHQAALNAGGRTLAVLPCGIDRVYPPEHAALAERICENGALLTEFSLGSPPDRNNFAPRNRIVSGLSLGVVIVEASAHSGAIITAHAALEQGREVFAVPGNATAQASQGTNSLIRDGARMTTSADDVVQELKLARKQVPPSAPRRVAQPPAASPTPPARPPDTRATEMSQARQINHPMNQMSPSEVAVLRLLKDVPQHLDDLVSLSGLPVGEVSSALTLLELKGLVRQEGVLRYALA